MKISVGVKVFSVVLVLVALVSAVAWINARSAREVESLIENIHAAYVPAYGALARANLRSVEEGLYVRRLIIAASEDVGNADPRALQVAVAAAQALGARNRGLK